MENWIKLVKKMKATQKTGQETRNLARSALFPQFGHVFCFSMNTTVPQWLSVQPGAMETYERSLGDPLFPISLVLSVH